MKPIIIANWKCNPTTLKEAKRIFNYVRKRQKGAEVVICPPFVFLPSLSGMKLGGQDAFWHESGPYTGEVSVLMLKHLGVKYVIVGHSERRKYFKEDNKTIFHKVEAVKRHKMTPILCVDKLSQLPKKKVAGLIVAYEPLSAIGTGKACSHEYARKMRLAIRKIVGRAPILYGGSVNPMNAKSYVKQAGFQGLLVGGASLKPREFVDIIKNVCYR